MPDFLSLDFIYYPVSAILWFWHKVFGAVLSPDSGIAWALSVVFLVFTLRAILFKPFVGQVRSMRKMQEFAPEIKKIKDKYGNDRQKQAAEMQKLQSEHGVNPLGGCLPILVQIPVFIGLFHVLRSFNRPFLPPEVNAETPNYLFGAEEVQSFLSARFLGIPLSSYITQPMEQLSRFGDISRVDIALVSIPFMIVAGILTYLTARHSVRRQSEAAAANPQAAIMNKVTQYLFPFGVVAGGPFFPFAIVLYWLSNNLWTLGQQYVVYRRIDAEESEKKEAATVQRAALAPKVGQKPQTKAKRSSGGTAVANGSSTESAPAPDTSPVEAADSAGATDSADAAEVTPQPSTDGAAGSGGAANGTAKGSTSGGGANGATDDGASKDGATKGDARTSGGNGATRPKATATGKGTSGGSRPAAKTSAGSKKKRKRR